MNERESLHYFATEIVGLTLNPAQERLVRLIDAEYDALRVVIVRKGRRVGMTACAGLIAAWTGTVLAPRFRQHLMPGEEFTITLVATSREQATVLLGFVSRFLHSSLMLAEQIVAETNNNIRLATGCMIEAVPCSARANRGRANAVVILDEGAHFIDSAGNASLRAVYDALRPPLAQFGAAGLMLVISTPLDGVGAFYELDQQAASGRFDDMAALHFPTEEANPALAVEAERERLRNPRQFDREWRGEYTSGDETLPLAAFDACVDQNYEAPYAAPSTPIVLALDGSVSRDSTALVGIDENWTLVYAREWKPPPNGTIDHREVLATLIDLSLRFPIVVIAYDPSQIHGLVLEGLDAGLPMKPISQAGGSSGGTMARYTSALLEALHERRLRLFACPELREHVARARLTARSGADRITKSRASDRIDLAVALAMAVGVLTDRWREVLENYAEEEVVIVPASAVARDYEEVRRDFYEHLAAEAAEAGDYETAQRHLRSLDW
jgi:hypothetical protein